MVKKVWTMIIVLVLCISALGGCGGDVVTEDNQGGQNENNDVVPTMEAPVKTGISITADVTGSKDASKGEPGLAKADVLVVAVTVDGNGVIDDCVIDQIPAEIQFDDQGRVITDPGTVFESKIEKGDSYGMRKASSIGKEWYEQAEVFSAYVTGKTLDQVAGIGLDESGKVTDGDLMASVTISVSEFVRGVEDAVRHAESLGAKQGDVISLGITATAEESEAAEGDDHGEASVQVTAVAETHNGSSVTSRKTEEYTAGVKFSRSGEITERVLDRD